MLGKSIGKIGFSLALAAVMLLAAPSPSAAAKAGGGDKGVVKLAGIAVKGSLPDTLPPVNPFGPQPMYFKKLLSLVRKAANDKEIAGIVLDVNSPAIGFGKTRELLQVLKEFKATGKKLFGYAESLGMKDLMILSPCDVIAVPESGVVIMPGLNIEMMYYKGFLEKLGIKFLVEHIGDYKSAFENFSRDRMSDELREVLNCLLDEFYGQVISTIAKNRGIDPLVVIRAVDQALITPDEAEDMGLIDRVCYKDEFDEYVKSVLKAKKVEVDKKYGRESVELDLNNPLALFSQIMSSLMKEKEKKKSKKPKIALIYASGPINSGKNRVDPFSGEATIGSDTLSKAILDAAEDDTVKAIVLRVDSPGGSGLASDIIWRAEMKAKRKKPLVVSMGDVAGSGGYYISIAADVIVAEPSTITGSIGVVSAVPNLNGTLDLLGIRLERLSRGRNAGALSALAPPEEVNVKLISRYMEKFYWKFVDKVAAGRHMTRKQVHAIAQGRVWTGRQAVENGLVDVLGGLDEAIQIAKVKAGITDDMNWELVEMPEAPDLFDSLSESLGLGSILSGTAKAPGLLPALQALGLDPALRSRMVRLATLFEICRKEPVLFLMPVDISVEF